MEWTPGTSPHEARVPGIANARIARVSGAEIELFERDLILEPRMFGERDERRRDELRCLSSWDLQQFLAQFRIPIHPVRF